jgi:hypothetical protein
MISDELMRDIIRMEKELRDKPIEIPKRQYPYLKSPSKEIKEELPIKMPEGNEIIYPETEYFLDAFIKRCLRLFLKLDSLEIYLEKNVILSGLETYSFPRFDKHVCMVYFFKCGSFVKIGISRNLKRRFKAIQSANPYEMEILYYLRGEEDLEDLLHDLFIKNNKHHRLEWFIYDKFTDYIIMLMNAIASYSIYTLDI